MYNSIDWFLTIAEQACLISLGLFLFFTASIYLSSLWGAPWVISSTETVKSMLELADLKEDELLYDLGSGDGRVLISAAQEFGAQAVGIEIDPLRCIAAKFFIWQKGQSRDAKVQWGNIYSYDISDADVVTLYLTRETNRKLRIHLETQLSEGTRVISNAFTIPGWTPTKIDNRNLLFMYIVGSTGESIITDFVTYDQN